MSILIKEIGLQKIIYKNTVKVCMIGSGLKTLMKSGDKIRILARSINNRWSLGNRSKFSWPITEQSRH